MAIKIKRGASITGCRKEILMALIKHIHPAFEVENLDTVVTSGCENYKHKVLRSAHYRGDALDIRSKHLGSIQSKKRVLARLKRSLDSDFIIILEAIGKPWEHYHIHWSPIHRED